MVEDRVQDLNSVTCGIFQVYFYDNFFNPDKNNKIQDKKQLNKRTIATLLNEPFALDNQDTNEATIKNTLTKTTLSYSRNLLRKLVTDFYKP